MFLKNEPGMHSSMVFFADSMRICLVWGVPVVVFSGFSGVPVDFVLFESGKGI